MKCPAVFQPSTCNVEGTRSHAIGLLAYLGGPYLWDSGHSKHVSLGSQGFAMVVVSDQGQLAGNVLGVSQMGLGSQALSAIPNLVGLQTWNYTLLREPGGSLIHMSSLEQSSSKLLIVYNHDDVQVAILRERAFIVQVPVASRAVIHFLPYELGVTGYPYSCSYNLQE